MIKYLKTYIGPNIIKPLLVRYMTIYKNNINVPKKLKQYLQDNYELTISTLASYIISSIDIKSLKDSLIEIRIKDRYIGETKLNKLVQLIEYGSREIPPAKYMSKLMDMSLRSVVDELGGL